MPDFAEDFGQAAEPAPEQPASTDLGSTLPAPADTDLPGLTYGDTDDEAMSSLLAASQDQDTPDASPAGEEEATPETPDAPAFASEYDDLSDDEIAQRAASMTPAQLRAAFGNGKAMQKGFHAKMREAADRERALADGQRQLAQQQQQLLDAYQKLQAPTTAPQAPAPPPEMDLSDVIDPVSGELNVAKFREAVKREAEAIVEAKVAPITAAEAQRREDAQQAETNRVVTQINATLDHMRKAFPHFGASPAVEQRVIDHMLSTNNPDPMAVYATLFRREYARTVYEFEQKQRRATAAPAKQQPAPPTPPGARGSGVPVVPETLADTTDAMAREIARLTGVPLRQFAE